MVQQKIKRKQTQIKAKSFLLYLLIANIIALVFWFLPDLVNYSFPESIGVFLEDISLIDMFFILPILSVFTFIALLIYLKDQKPVGKMRGIIFLGLIIPSLFILYYLCFLIQSRE